MSWNKIDTHWDDPNGWAKQTGPFLNTLHPITANIVERAVRVRGCYAMPVIQEFIKRADVHIRSLVEHTDKKFATFDIENYSPKDLARITDYVKKCTRAARNYYEANNSDVQLNPLHCVDMSIGNLSDFLESIEGTLNNKFTPLCLKHEMRNDIHNLLSYMEEAKHEESIPEAGKATIVEGVVIPDENELFENEMSIVPPKELKHVESMIRVQCADEKSVREFMRKFAKTKGRYMLAGSRDAVIITPTIFDSEHQLSIKMVRDALNPAESFLKENGYRHTGSSRDEWGWLNAVWKT